MGIGVLREDCNTPPKESPDHKGLLYQANSSDFIPKQQWLCQRILSSRVVIASAFQKGSGVGRGLDAGQALGRDQLASDCSASPGK